MKVSTLTAPLVIDFWVILHFPGFCLIRAADLCIKNDSVRIPECLNTSVREQYARKHFSSLIIGVIIFVKEKSSCTWNPFLHGYCPRILFPQKCSSAIAVPSVCD